MKRRLNELTATQLSELLKNRQCSPTEIAKDCLEQIANVEPLIDAWVYLDPRQVMLEAERLDKNSTNPISPLNSIPVGIKDIFNTRDMPTQMGSPIWKDFEPGNDARVVHYLKMAESLIVGKTVTAEFAVHAPGPTKNPHNTAHSPGTSSSGSAAAVAARMVPVAIGTQTAGSIIRPSSYCGIFGFKPSFGLIPRTGVLKTTDTLDTIGVMARCVQDISTTFDTIRVKGRDFPISENILNNSSRQNKKVDAPWRLALVKGPKWNDAESYAQKELLSFANILPKSGRIVIEEIELPGLFDQAHSIHSTIYDRTLAYYFKREFNQHTLVSDNIYEIIERGNQISVDQYRDALHLQEQLYSIFDGILTKFDALIGLSTGGEALRGLDSVDRPDNCLIWTLCGAPSISIPAFLGPNALPFGVQLVGRRYGDFKLLKLAQELEEMGYANNCPMPSLAVSTATMDVSQKAY